MSPRTCQSEIKLKPRPLSNTNNRFLFDYRNGEWHLYSLFSGREYSCERAVVSSVDGVEGYVLAVWGLPQEQVETMPTRDCQSLFRGSAKQHGAGVLHLLPNGRIKRRTRIHPHSAS